MAVKVSKVNSKKGKLIAILKGKQVEVDFDEASFSDLTTEVTDRLDEYRSCRTNDTLSELLRGLGLIDDREYNVLVTIRVPAADAGAAEDPVHKALKGLDYNIDEVKTFSRINPQRYGAPTVLYREV